MGHWLCMCHLFMLNLWALLPRALDPLELGEERTGPGPFMYPEPVSPAWARGPYRTMQGPWVLGFFMHGPWAHGLMILCILSSRVSVGRKAPWAHAWALQGPVIYMTPCDLWSRWQKPHGPYINIYAS